MENNKKKTLVDEALLDIKVIQEALQKNTKEILRSTMREEIDEIVKEYVANEQGYEEEEVDTDIDGETEVDVDTDTTDDIEAGEESGEEFPLPIGGEEAPEENPIDTPEMDYDEMDMTAASDEEVIKVFKKLSAEDEVEVVSDTEVKITDPESGNEYVVTLGGNKPSEMETEPEALEMGLDSLETEPEALEVEPEGEESEIGIDDIDIDAPTEESTEPVYEITLDEDIVRTATGDIEASMTGNMPNGDIEGQTAEKSEEIDGDNLTGGFVEDTKGGKDAHAEHVMESDDEDEEIVDENKSRAQPDLHANRVRPDGKDEYHTAPIGRANESVSHKKFNELLTVAKKLQTENKEVKTVLGKFRKMLAESVVYNTNLTYMVKIITEHSTSKEEKKEIMNRFDNVKTLKESKSLYKTINGELGTKKPITESINKKIDKPQFSGSSSKLNESTAYVDTEAQRIKDLISRVENKDKY